MTEGRDSVGLGLDAASHVRPFAHTCSCCIIAPPALAMHLPLAACQRSLLLLKQASRLATLHLALPCIFGGSRANSHWSGGCATCIDFAQCSPSGQGCLVDSRMSSKRYVCAFHPAARRVLMHVHQKRWLLHLQGKLLVTGPLLLCVAALFQGRQCTRLGDCSTRRTSSARSWGCSSSSTCSEQDDQQLLCVHTWGRGRRKQCFNTGWHLPEFDCSRLCLMRLGLP